MSPPLWGHIYDFELKGARAEAVLVVSENDWNSRTRDVVVVPLYGGGVAEAGNVRIAIKDGLVADCTRVQNVAQDVIGADRGASERQALLRVRLGLRVYLDIDRLVDRARPRASAPDANTGWWPRQGQVRYAEVPGFPADKMFCVVSEDDWNSRTSTAYSAALRLMSKTRRWRSQWEVEIGNRWIVAGHLYSLLHADIDQAVPSSPRPREACPEELHQLAMRLSVLLKLR